MVKQRGLFVRGQQPLLNMTLTSDELGKELGPLAKVFILGHVVLDEFLSSLIAEEVLLRLHFSVPADSNMNMIMSLCIFVRRVISRQPSADRVLAAGAAAEIDFAAGTKQLVAEFVVVAILWQHATSDILAVDLGVCVFVCLCVCVFVCLGGRQGCVSSECESLVSDPADESFLTAPNGSPAREDPTLLPTRLH
jgi:hypothetical protein